MPCCGAVRLQFAIVVARPGGGVHNVNSTRNSILAYAAALAFVAAAVLLRWWLDPYLGDSVAFITLYGAVALAVWVGGVGPALLATVVGYVAADYLFLEPRGYLHVDDVAAAVRLAAYLLSCGLIVLFGDLMRRARYAAEASAREVAQQREQLKVSLSSIGDAVIATDRAGRITFLNRVAADLTRWPEDEAVGEPLEKVFRIINEQSREAVESPAARALMSGTVVGLANHTILIAKDGSERPIDDSAAPIRDAAGAVSGVILVFRDVSERRRQHIAMHQLAAIIASSEDAIISKNLDGIVTSWNPAAERLYGYAAAEIVGRSKSMVIPPDRPHELAEVLERIREGRRVEPYETQRLRKDGTRIDVAITVSPVRDEAGDIVGAATIARDITARKRYEAALREADRRKDEFLATLAHELRNPLAPLSNALQVLKHAGADTAIAEKARGLMERQLAHLVRLVDDLLDVSRITTGKIELRKERVEVRAVVESALETSRPLIEQSGHRLTVSLPDSPLMLDADPTRMAQVLSNLLNNAAKYTDGGGTIVLTARRQGHEALIEVQDDGIGIAPEALPRLFEIFSQVDRSLGRAQGGLGIGLSLVRGLVELHGGSVSADSEGLGRGSRFTVRLPLAEGPPETGDDARKQELPPLTGRRILVVDDNRDSADSLSLLLGFKGHTVRTAYEGPHAIEQAKAFRPDVVLLDIGLPGMNGYEVARRMRAEAAMLHATLVATTGWGHAEDKRRAREAGFDFHLTKPVSIEALERFLGGLGGTPGELRAGVTGQSQTS
jgi:PAS domain S-box-containing protein